jgi:hypothetical protein
VAAVAAVVGLQWSVPPLLALVVVGIAAVVWWVGEGRVNRARSGVVGEREVAGFLGGFGTVLFGWQPPGARFDVDVVVLEPCLVAVEVKRADGRVRVRHDGTVLVDGVAIPGDPLTQAVRGAVSLRRVLDVDEFVAAVLCVTGMRQRPRHVEHREVPVTICSGRHLRRVVKRAGDRVSRRQAREMVAVLTGGSRQ